MGKLAENFDLRKSRKGDKVVVVSDNPKDNITFKDKFAGNGFQWDGGLKSWWMPINKTQSAIAALERINNEMYGGYDDDVLFEYLNLEKDSIKKRLYVVSDMPNEVYNNYAKLKTAGFWWDKYAKVWWIPESMMQKGITALEKINTELQSGGQEAGLRPKFLAGMEHFKEFVKQKGGMDPETTKMLDAKLDQYIQDIANATDEKAASAEIMRFYEFMNKFHKYSFSNCLLIYIQKRGASRVAGKGAWGKLNRKVKAGATPISIWCVKKFYIDPKSGKPKAYGMDQQKRDRERVKAGSATQEELDDIVARGRIVSQKFDPCVVYDLSDTEGADLPDEPMWKGAGDDREDAELILGLAEKSLAKMGIRMTRDTSSRGEGGWSRGGHINVSADQKGSAAVSTAIHEWAHELVHQPNSMFFDKSIQKMSEKGELTGSQVKQIKEIQVETVSALVCKRYGFSVEHHPTYMALWQKNGGMSSRALIEKNQGLIKKVSNFIVNRLDSELTADTGPSEDK